MTLEGVQGQTGTQLSTAQIPAFQGPILIGLDRKEEKLYLILERGWRRISRRNIPGAPFRPSGF